MDSSGDNMRFEMDEVPPHFHPQTSLEPSSLNTTRIDSQRPVTLPQGLFALDERLEYSANFAWAEPHGIFPPESSLLCPTIYFNSSFMQPDHASVHHFSSFGQSNVSSQSQNALPPLDQPSHPQQPAQLLTRKRAPKAPTISAKTWEPHKNRIRQIYVSEGKSIEELREIMNEELGITATLRQYKVQIQQMNLERNVKAKERKAVVKHIQHRAHAVGKKCSHVRVRGHEINEEKLFRWVKENLMDQPTISASPPSHESFYEAFRITLIVIALPSCISISTNSVCETLKQASPVILKHQQLVNRFTTSRDMTSTLMQRLLKYAHNPKHMIESQEARAVFNDLQLILRNEYTAGKKWNEDNWNPSVEEDIIQVRNLMNVTHGLLVNSELKETQKLVPFNDIRHRVTNLSKVTNKHAAWITPYGTVQASFWSVSNDSSIKTLGDATGIANNTIAARLSIVPRGTSPFRVVLDFTPHLDPSATITYQAMIPNDSEIFKIASDGKVEELIGLIEKGTASLTDRDEEGRSLLSYATTDSNIDMCNFLVDKKADVNAIELNFIGYIMPVFSHRRFNDFEAKEIMVHAQARCTQIMLEAGADFSLEGNEGAALWTDAFANVVQERSLAALKHVLDFGEPFICPNGIYKSSWGEHSALTMLAYDCGYIYREIMEVVEKAILLLNRKADISCRDGNGDTVLHTVLKCKRLYERVSKSRARKNGTLGKWAISFKAPKDLLMVFITADADVYATNDKGETPSMVASRYGREDEWIEVLELCGYEPEEVLSCCIHRPTREHQRSKLSFQEYCQQRQPVPHHPPRWHPLSGRYTDDYSLSDDKDECEEVHSEDTDDDSQSDDEDEYEKVQSEDNNDSQYGDGDAYEEDDHEETRVITDDTECVDGGDGNMDLSGRVECADYDMDIGLDDEGKKHTYSAEEMVDDQTLDLDDTADNGIEATDVNLDDWLDNGRHFMQSFDDFDIDLDPHFE